MTEKEKNRKIGAYKANETRKLAKLNKYDSRGRAKIKKEFAEKIAAVESESSVKTTSVKCTCKCGKMNSNPSTVYEVYTREKGRFVFVGKTTKNPIK